MSNYPPGCTGWEPEIAGEEWKPDPDDVADLKYEQWKDEQYEG